jgi:flagellar basal-body rod protein FlgF
MDRALYIAMSGAKQTLAAQNSSANNLANMNTTGFKADLSWFTSRPVTGAGYPTRVYAMNEKPGTDLSPGNMQNTGRNLDIAVNGKGLVAVRGEDGQEAYTKAGDLHTTAEGILLTHTGLQVIGNNGPITIPPSENLTIGTDGTISIIPLGSGNATTMQVLDRIKLVNPNMDDMQKLGDGLIHAKNARPLDASADVTLLSGVLEGSNIKGFSAMTEMIDLARNFELQVKVMKSITDNSAASAKLMQLA